MEEKGAKALNFQFQLQNLSNLQSRIEETRRSLNQLSKIESNEKRQIDSILKTSMLTTRNKFNLFETHSLNERRHKQQTDELKNRQEKVREMKEKEEKELQEMRNQLKKNKQNERLIIRNNSMQFGEAIKRNQKAQVQKKEQLVKEMKLEKQQYQESLMNSRMLEKQQKEAMLFNNTLAKIERQPSMAKELTRLIKQKDEIEGRVNERKELKEKMRAEVDRLKKMKEDELVQIIVQTESKQKFTALDRLAPLPPHLMESLHLRSVVSQPHLHSLQSPSPSPEPI